MKNFLPKSVGSQLAAIIFLNCLLNLHGLWVPFYNIDELSNAIHARFINAGDLTLSDFLGNTYLLTHYLYALIYQFVESNTLIPLHVVHIFWKCGSILAFYWAGCGLADKKTGIWAALFYCVCSMCFMSKDFHTPSAESFSLLPAVLAAGCAFRAVSARQTPWYFAAGFLAVLAAFFKAPMGVMIVGLGLMVLARQRDRFRNLAVLNFGFVTGLALPAFFVSPPGSGFVLMLEKITETHQTYIQAHEGISLLYWIMKFIIRTGLVLGCCLTMTAFAFYALRFLFRLRRNNLVLWDKLFFLSVWLVFIWFTVALGKRVFYHYFVFLLAPLSLLAGVGIRYFDRANRIFSGGVNGTKGLKWLRKNLAFWLALPAVIFFAEGAFNYSTMAGDFGQAIEYVSRQTDPSERIYIWGNVPQVYFYSERLPSTVYFWSDILAGTSPGSPAMEYIRATGKSLKLEELIVRDFRPRVFEEKDPAEFQPQGALSRIGESDLFTVEEILERIDHDYWQKVFRDFLSNPPVYFIDSSPANVRGFGHYPIQKHELLKRFVWDNYELETVIDGLIFYRLKREIL